VSQEFQREYLIRLPLPLAQLYQRAYNDKSAFSRHNNTFYLFEALVKLAAAAAAAAYIQEIEAGAPHDAAVDRTLVHLALPSLGQWVGMLRALAHHFSKCPDSASHPLGHLWAQLNQTYRDRPGLLALYRRIKNSVDGAPAGDESCTPMQVLDALIPYRNAVFGHGAGRAESFYEHEMGPLLFPAANELLAEGMLEVIGPRGSRLVQLAELRVVGQDRVEVGLRELVGERSSRAASIVLSLSQAAALAPGPAAVLWPGWPVPLRLDPLLLYREGELGDEVLFLNRDRHGSQVEYLSYTRGEPERDRATAPALAALLGRVTGREVSAEQLARLSEQSVAETPTVEILIGPQPIPVRTVGDYEILAEIGRGGMGVVYLAWQISLGRLLALKLLPADLAADEVALARFRREMRLLARCDHPNIVKVLASGTLPDGRLYYAMEYVPGSDLEHVWRELAGSSLPGDSLTLGSTTWARAVLSASRKLREESAQRTAGAEPSPQVPPAILPLPPLPELPLAPDETGGYTRRVAALLRDAALALQAVHDQHVVHRDIKPGNLMLSPDGTRVVLMDFGLAKGQEMEMSAGHSGGLLGTLRYASPEQLAAASLRVGPEADVRGLGVTLWELLTRRRLFAEAVDERQLATMVHDQDVPRLRTIDRSFDRDLEAIVARATERRVADRIASAGQLAEYLQLYLDGKTLPIRPPSIGELGMRWAARNRAPLAAAAAFLVLTTSLVVGTKVASDRAFHRLQIEAESDVERGNTALLGADARSASALLASALGKIGGEPRLAGLKDRAQRLLDLANRRLEEQIERQRDAARYATFMAHYDDALLNGTLFTGRDSGAERAKTSARKALAVFGCRIDDAGAKPVALDLAASSLDEREKARLRACCYEISMLWALLDSLGGATDRSTAGPSAASLDRTGERTDRARRLISEARTSHHVLSGGTDEPAATLAVTSPDAQLQESVDRFLTGLARYYASDLKQAIRQFEGALQSYPDHYWSQHFLALCHLKARHWGEAKIAFNACLSRKPESPWPLMFRGYAAAEMHDVEAAETDFARALALAPNDYGILVNRGAMRIRHGKLAEASADLRRAIAREPDQYQAYTNLARVFSAQERWSDAIQQIDQAIRCAPKVALLYRNRARIQREAGNRKEAQRAYALALSLEPADSPLAHLCRAEENLAQGRYREAVQSFDAYERLEAPDAQFYQGRGLARAVLGDYPGAVDDYTKSLELEPNTNVSARRGWAYAQHNDQLALREFDQSVALNGENLDAHAGRGYALARLGRHREAVREAELALPHGIRDWQQKYNVACIYAQAVAAAKNDAGAPDHVALSGEYAERAARLIRAALELVGEPGKRAGVWAVMEADSALDPLRGTPEFGRLAAEFGGKSR
jgi:serine/threonine protein kinase/tetratricopeptide (TPR) repeat protein